MNLAAWLSFDVNDGKNKAYTNIQEKEKRYVTASDKARGFGVELQERQRVRQSVTASYDKVGV